MILYHKTARRKRGVVPRGTIYFWPGSPVLRLCRFVLHPPFAVSCCSGSAVFRCTGSFAVSHCARPLLFPAAPALVVLRCAGSFAVSHCARPFAVSYCAGSFAVSAAPALLFYAVTALLPFPAAPALPFPAATALLPFSYSASRSPARRRFIRFFRLSRIPAFACGAAASSLPAACASAFYPAARGLSHVCAAAPALSSCGPIAAAMPQAFLIFICRPAPLPRPRHFLLRPGAAAFFLRPALLLRGGPAPPPDS